MGWDRMKKNDRKKQPLIRKKHKQWQNFPSTSKKLLDREKNQLYIGGGCHYCRQRTESSEQNAAE